MIVWEIVAAGSLQLVVAVICKPLEPPVSVIVHDGPLTVTVAVLLAAFPKALVTFTQ
jgi:hypothetical protein